MNLKERRTNYRIMVKTKTVLQAVWSLGLSKLLSVCKYLQISSHTLSLVPIMPPLWKRVCVHSNGQISARMSLKYRPDLADPCDCLGGFNLSPSTRCSPLGPDTQGQTSSFTYPAPLILTDPLGHTALTSSHASSASWLRRCWTNTNHTDETTYFLLMASGLHKQHGNNQNKEQSLWMNKQRSVIWGRAPVFFLRGPTEGTCLLTCEGSSDSYKTPTVWSCTAFSSIIQHPAFCWLSAEACARF